MLPQWLPPYHQARARVARVGGPTRPTSRRSSPLGEAESENRSDDPDHREDDPGRSGVEAEVGTLHHQSNIVPTACSGPAVGMIQRGDQVSGSDTGAGGTFRELGVRWKGHGHRTLPVAPCNRSHHGFVSVGRRMWRPIRRCWDDFWCHGWCRINVVACGDHDDHRGIAVHGNRSTRVLER